MESKIASIVCWSRKKAISVLEENKLRYSVFPDLTGDVVLFFGFDQYLFAKGKRKFDGNAIVKESPSFVRGLGLPVIDSVYQGCGHWVAMPTASINLPLPKVKVKKTLMYRLSLENAKKLAKKLES